MLISEIPLLLIPICALLNHLGGQSTVIPNPRIVCRVFGMAMVFAAAAYFSGVPLDKTGWCGLAALAGFALWAVPGWASGFCCIPPYNDGRQDTALSELVNSMTDTNHLQKLPPDCCRYWGVVYFTLRGLYLYPMFLALAWLLNPWVAVIGAICLTQGAIYGTAQYVSIAEWRYGMLIGAALCAALMLG